MAAEPGPESLSARADGSGLCDAGMLAGGAWLAALPAEVAAQRRVMAGLVDRCEAWPLVMSLLVGCSLGRGGAQIGISGAAVNRNTYRIGPDS